MTTRFEEQLRAQLREAADEAPAFRGLSDDWSTRRATRRRTRPWLAAAAAVVITGAAIGVGWQVLPGGSGGHPGGGANASCAMTLKFHGVTYVLGGGDQVRTPHRGEALGTGIVPGCNDTGVDRPAPSKHRRVYAIPGISPQQAILGSEGLVLVPRASHTLPAALREIYQPLACTRSGQSTMSGHLTGETFGGLREDAGRVRVPYTATFEADRGSWLPLKRYTNVRITVRITDATTGGQDAALARAALQEGKRVAVTMRCDGSKFVATALRAAAK